MGFGEDNARAISSLEAGLSDTQEAICVGVDWPNRVAQINVGGVVQSMPWVGESPWNGDRVRVVTAGLKPFCVAVWGAALGTVATVGSNLATVTGDDGQTYTYPYLSGAAPTAGWRVVLDHAHRFVGSRISTEPAGSVVVLPPAPPVGASGSATFYPTDSGNFRSGSYDGPYVEISSTRSAAYWYGAQIANTIPDSAVITVATISLVELWDNVPGTSTQMGYHTQQARGAEPTITGTVNVNNTGTYDISAYADGLKIGASYGLGFRKNTGWRRYDTAANSGAIYMAWTV